MAQKTAHIGRKKPKNTSAIDKREVRQIRKDLEALGYRTRRQPGSGNRDITLQHDVWWGDSPMGALHIEDKFRTDSCWKTLETWKAGADILTVREARCERMVFMSWELFLDMVGPGVDDTGDYIVSLQENVLTPENKITKPKRKIQSQGFQKGHRPMRRAP